MGTLCTWHWSLERDKADSQTRLQGLTTLLILTALLLEGGTKGFGSPEGSHHHQGPVAARQKQHMTLKRIKCSLATRTSVDDEARPRYRVL